MNASTESRNQKYLDYEIETPRNLVQLKSLIRRNQKYLDYEIETS